MVSEGVNRVQRSCLRGVNRVFRTLSGDIPLPILQTPCAGHCLDTHGEENNQEPRKGGFSKGGFCRVQCHSQGNKKYLGILAPAVHLAPRAPQLREAHILQKPPSKNPLFLVPETRTSTKERNQANEVLRFIPLGLKGSAGSSQGRSEQIIWGRWPGRQWDSHALEAEALQACLGPRGAGQRSRSSHSMHQSLDGRKRRVLIGD